MLVFPWNSGYQGTVQTSDTAGAEQYQSLVPLYFRGALYALLIFSVTDRDSFDVLDKWYSQIFDARPD
jgi:GTPase SAR1 family protein